MNLLCVLCFLMLLQFAWAQQVAITKDNHVYTFWYNSSNTDVATYTFDYCDIVTCTFPQTQHAAVYKDIPNKKDPYICVTGEGWGHHCSSWKAAGWNTGRPWGYRPQIALDKLDKDGKPLLSRMTLSKPIGSTPIKLTLNIEHPSPRDAGEYVMGMYWKGGGSHNALGTFYLQDMLNSSDWVGTTHMVINPLKPHIKTLHDMVAIANPTFEDTMAVETGFSDTNLWLEWMRYNANSHNKTNCYVCGGARPHLGTVPLSLPPEIELCVLSLYAQSTTNSSTCESWKKIYPITHGHVKPPDGVTIYPGNYTCYSIPENTGLYLGKFPSGYCSTYHSPPVSLLMNHTKTIGDIYWLCGDKQLRPQLAGQWWGECALTKVIMPIHIIPDGDHNTLNLTHIHSRTKRETPIRGSFDPHVYIDAIGVPRGVPNEFKARDEVAAGFESLIPMITANKNVNWINYIYYNQQRFVNYTRDALQGLAEQLQATTQMTFQNRMALDMILAEKGGVCKILPETMTCCTYIPDNTGPNGKVTMAIEKLDSLADELKKNSGVTDIWDKWFGWMNGWQKTLFQVGTAVLMVFIIFLFSACCILPCIQKYLQKAVDKTVDNVTPTFIHQDITDLEDDTPHTPLQTHQFKQTTAFL